MKKRQKIIDISLGILSLLSAAIIAVSFSALIPCFFKGFYTPWIKWLDIPSNSGFSYDEIKYAYSNILDFIWRGKQFNPGIPMSEVGIDHFRDCIPLFWMQFWMFLSSLIVLVTYFTLVKLKKVNIVKLGKLPLYSYGGILLVVLLVAIGVFALIDFNALFLLFHKVFFPGKDNWQFDPNVDQVIRILPEEYFLVCAVFIISISLFFAAFFVVVGFIQTKKGNRKEILSNRNKEPSKLLISISSLDDLKLDAYGYVLGYEKYTLFGACYFSYDEIKEIKDKNIYILMNALIHQKDLEKAIKEVDKLIPLGVSFIVQDLGLLSYLLTKVDKSKILFFPYTWICNKEELESYYDTYDVSINVSNELTLEEIKDILSFPHSVFNLFGYTPIYQSYRKILSLYDKKKGKSTPREDLYLKEHTRDELYPVIENEYGAVIFRGSPNSYLEDYEYIKNAEYLFIDSFHIEHDLFIEILNLSNKLLKGEIDRKEVLERYKELGFISKDYFKYQKTVVRK